MPLLCTHTAPNCPVFDTLDGYYPNLGVGPIGQTTVLCVTSHQVIVFGDEPRSSGGPFNSGRRDFQMCVIVVCSLFFAVLRLGWHGGNHFPKVDF